MDRVSRSRLVRGRKGFALVAIVVTVVILAVIAAAALPYLNESSHEVNATRTAQILRTLEQDLTNNTGNNGLQGFCQRVTACPKQLSHMTRQILSTDLDACSGGTYGNTNANRWIQQVPYTGLPISPGYGVWTPLGIVHDSVIRTSKGNIELHIDSLSLNDAVDLDIAVDGAAGAGAGQLTYAPTAVNTSGQTLELAKYLIAVTNAQCP